MSTISSLAKSVPVIVGDDGRSSMDHKSYEWGRYKAALIAKGIAKREREMGVVIRSAVAQACELVIADCEGFMQRTNFIR